MSLAVAHLFEMSLEAPIIYAGSSHLSPSSSDNP